MKHLTLIVAPALLPIAFASAQVLPQFRMYSSATIRYESVQSGGYETLSMTSGTALRRNLYPPPPGLQNPTGTTSMIFDLIGDIAATDQDVTFLCCGRSSLDGHGYISVVSLIPGPTFGVANSSTVDLGVGCDPISCEMDPVTRDVFVLDLQGERILRGHWPTGAAGPTAFSTICDQQEYQFLSGARDLMLAYIGGGVVLRSRDGNLRWSIDQVLGSYFLTQTDPMPLSMERFKVYSPDTVNAFHPVRAYVPAGELEVWDLVTGQIVYAPTITGAREWRDIGDPGATPVFSPGHPHILLDGLGLNRRSDVFVPALRWGAADDIDGIRLTPVRTSHLGNYIGNDAFVVSSRAFPSEVNPVVLYTPTYWLLFATALPEDGHPLVDVGGRQYVDTPSPIGPLVGRELGTGGYGAVGSGVAIQISIPDWPSLVGTNLYFQWVFTTPNGFAMTDVCSMPVLSEKPDVQQFLTLGPWTSGVSGMTALSDGPEEMSVSTRRAALDAWWQGVESVQPVEGTSTLLMELRRHLEARSRRSR